METLNRQRKYKEQVHLRWKEFGSFLFDIFRLIVKKESDSSALHYSGLAGRKKQTSDFKNHRYEKTSCHLKRINLQQLIMGLISMKSSHTG